MAASFTVESWDPDFGTAVPATELAPTEAEVDPFVELPAADWAPIDPSATEIGSVTFIDGVRRIDARVWISEGPRVGPGICASCAAGSVDEGRIREVTVHRELFTSSDVRSIETSLGSYHLSRVERRDQESLYAAVQQRLREIERDVAVRVTGKGKLLVVDGPLSASHPKGATVGYVKTHQVSYLPDELSTSLYHLKPGQRTPLFLTTTSWRRHSCYLRLPGARIQPWSGIVRLEVDGDGALAEAVRIVNRACAALPRFASLPHKDPRAPQNLFPIGGLERELRRRLGDARLLYRALREAAAASEGS